MRNIFYILAICTLVSCDVQKKISKSETDTNYKEVFEQKEYRKGDTVRFEIPVAHYKDTVIYVRSEKGTTQKIIYDSQGKASTECISAAVDIVTSITKELQQQQKEKDKDEDYKLDLTPLIWALAGLGFVVLLMLILIAWILYKIKKPTSILPT